MLLKIITNTLKKVLFIDDKICNRTIIFAAVGLKLTCSAIYCHDFDQNGPPYCDCWLSINTFSIRKAVVKIRFALSIILIIQKQEPVYYK